MNNHFKKIILDAIKAQDIYNIKLIQDLWSGYGSIIRYGVIGADISTIIVKHIKLPQKDSHPRGWNSDRSHQRKLRSYQVEMNWYKNYSHKCNDNCRIPHYITHETGKDEFIIVLEDLDNAGYPKRKNSVSWNEVKRCLSWLANFHAIFMGERPSDLWKTGTYWHLKTRPDELKVLDDKLLKNAAAAIDLKLNSSPFQTFVHGDAKLANFCFSSNDKVAAVDFQYTGGGCGMKDVAYLIGSCFYEDQCEKMESQVLNYYFNELENALLKYNKNINFTALKKDWQELYPVAWTDFHRFIKGWSPGHWKINSYSEKLSRKVINDLKQV